MNKGGSGPRWKILLQGQAQSKDFYIGILNC